MAVFILILQNFFVGKCQHPGQVGKVELVDIKIAESFADLCTIDTVVWGCREVVAGIAGTGEEDIQALVGIGNQVRSTALLFRVSEPMRLRSRGLSGDSTVRNCMSETVVSGGWTAGRRRHDATP